MSPDFQVGGEIENQVVQGHVLQEFGFGKRRLTSRTVLAAAEGAMQMEDDVAEHVTEEKETEEVVAEELKVRRI